MRFLRRLRNWFSAKLPPAHNTFLVCLTYQGKKIEQPWNDWFEVCTEVYPWIDPETGEKGYRAVAVNNLTYLNIPAGIIFDGIGYGLPDWDDWPVAISKLRSTMMNGGDLRVDNLELRIH